MGLAASERVPRELPGTSHPVRTWREGALTRHKTFWYLLASRTLRNKCCVSHAVCGILLQRPQQTQTLS